MRLWTVLFFSAILTGFSQVEVSHSESTVEIRKAPQKEIYNQCHLCHTKKNKKYISLTKKLSLQHSGFSSAHGKTEISCHSCHDVNHSNYLRHNTTPEGFRRPSRVCFQCHADVVKDWENGLHGKRVGHWSGKKTQWNCINCHQAHSVTFKKMTASPLPRPIKKGEGNAH